ncbi:hypothetical protein HH308_09780 [Gordonia sp. TBRC 11910]|uniref:Secreted protein n=1 Tax=Gordonia asplenii TaxID=2725283 RepID=A0A848KST8_9ACTN|nr:hypothetical protein [Gordonia asplenii]NMO01500.1 hypothetical protein [Gordonia asplenii]
MLKKVIVMAGVALASSLLAPTAQASTPNPGDACTSPGTVTSPTYGALTCDMQAQTWISGSLSGGRVTVGGPCGLAGDVRLAHGEDLARCVNGTWQTR